MVTRKEALAFIAEKQAEKDARRREAELAAADPAPDPGELYAADPPAGRDEGASEPRQDDPYADVPPPDDPPGAGESRGKRRRGEDPPPARVLSWRTAAEVSDRCPEWAWHFDGHGRLMRATLILYAGRPDAGKSTAARYFGAGYTRGTVSGCFCGDPQNIAYIAAEESLEVMVKPSLRAHGADLDRVYFPEVRMDGNVVRLLSNVDEAALTADFKARSITVVIVDPVMSAISSVADARGSAHCPQPRPRAHGRAQRLSRTRLPVTLSARRSACAPRSTES